MLLILAARASLLEGGPVVERTLHKELADLGWWICVLRGLAWESVRAWVTFVSSTVPGTGLCVGLAVNSYFFGWNKCITALLCSLIWTDWNHLHREIWVAAAVCSMAEDAGYTRSTYGTRLKGLPASSCLLCRCLDSVVMVSPALACGLVSAHLILPPNHAHLG